MRNNVFISEQEHRGAVQDIAFRVTFKDRFVSGICLAVAGAFGCILLAALIFRVAL
jgi:hypothetical protein